MKSTKRASGTSNPENDTWERIAFPTGACAESAESEAHLPKPLAQG
jgi:hypothetical protein